MMNCPRVTKIAIGKAQGAQEKNLEKPVKHDGDFAEEKCAVNIRRNENVVKYQKRHGQHRRRAQNIQRVRQRNEAPFGGGEIESVADDHAERDEIGKDAQQQRKAIEEKLAFKPQIETG